MEMNNKELSYLINNINHLKSIWNDRVSCFLYCELSKTFQKRNVSSPAPVRIDYPEGLIAK